MELKDANVQRLKERVLHVVVEYTHGVVLLLLPKPDRHSGLLVRDVESEVDGEHERAVPCALSPLPTRTLHAAKIHEEGHLVATIVIKEGMEDRVARRAS